MRQALCNLILTFTLTTVVAVAGEEQDYSLQDINGITHRVSDLKGKFLVMNFWATWCAPCIHEMPELEKFYQNNKDSAVVWGITFEDTDLESIKSFVNKLNVSYPILGYGQDPETGYGHVKVLPTTFIIDQDGKFLHRFEGPITEQDIIEVISQ